MLLTGSFILAGILFLRKSLGVNWNVEIVPVKAFNFTQSDVALDEIPVGDDSDIIEVIDYAINDAKVDIVNASWTQSGGKEQFS